MQFYNLKEENASHSEEEELNAVTEQRVTETPMDEDEEDEYVQQNESPSRSKGKTTKRSSHSAGLPKRRQVKNACITCRKDHGRCDDHRPCSRCTKLGIADDCMDAPRKRSRSKATQIELDKEEDEEEEDEVVPLEGQTTRFILRRRKSISTIQDSGQDDTEEENEENVISSSATDNFSAVVTTRKIRRRIQQQVRFPNPTLVSSIETVTSTSTEPKILIEANTPNSPNDAIKYCKPKFKFVMKTIVFCEHPPSVEFPQNPNL